ncbi:MAG: hypothetical protein ACTSVV_05395 [Promethearchaeota archaeon]
MKIITENPFYNLEISRYPVTSDFFTNKIDFDVLYNYLESNVNSELPNFFILFGDWGQGKTRIAHQLITEFINNNSHVSWQIKDNDEFVSRKILIDGYLPLFTTMRHVLRLVPLTEDNIISKIIISAIKNLLNGSEQIYVDVRKKLLEINEEIINELESFDFDDNKPYKYIQNVAKILLTKSNHKINKILIILDEVEMTGELIGQLEENIRDQTNIESMDIIRLFNAIKIIKNIQKSDEQFANYQNFDFLFLCTLEVAKLFKSKTSESVSRRLTEHFLTPSTLQDFIHFTNNLCEKNSTKKIPIPLIKSIAFFTYYNFGWYLYIMSKLYSKYINSDKIKLWELLEQNLKTMSSLFNITYFKDIEDHSDRPENFDLFKKVVFSIFPIKYEDKYEDLLKYKTPENFHFLTKLKKVKFQFGDIKFKLINILNLKASREGILEFNNQTKIDFNKLKKAFKLFNDETNYYLVYENEEEFKKFLMYFLGYEIDEEFINKIYQEIFSPLFKDQNTIEFIGLTIEAITNLSIRWEQKILDIKWLRNDIWEKVQKAISNLPENEKYKRALNGYVKLKLLKISENIKPPIKVDREKIRDNDELLPNFASEAIIFEMNPDDIINISNSQKAIVYYYSGERNLYNDLNKFKILDDWPLFIIIYLNDKDLDSIKKLIKKDFLKLNSWILLKKIRYNSDEFHFYLILSYFGDLYDSVSNLRSFEIKYKKYLEKNENIEKNWLNFKDRQNMFVKYIFKGNAKNWNKISQCLKNILLDTDINSFSDLIDRIELDKRSINKAWEAYFAKYKENKEITIKFFENMEGIEFSTTLKPIFPSQFTKILNLIKKNINSLDDISKHFFFPMIKHQDKVKAIKQSISFLEDFNIIYKDQINEKYFVIDKNYLIPKVEKAQRLLITILNSETNGINELKNFYQSLLPKINFTRLDLEPIRNKLENLENEINNIEFKISNLDEFISVYNKIKEIKNIYRRVINE